MKAPHGTTLAHLVIALPLVLLAWIAAVPNDAAAAFGTIASGGQNREHDRITRAALACPAGTGSDGLCFEPASLDLLAGHGREFGAVGAPDSDELSNSAAHCDNADFRAGPYPQTGLEATGVLLQCIEHLRYRYREAVSSATGLLATTGRIDRSAVSVERNCRFFEAAERRVKCTVIESFGRLLHGAQDFYAHSNWADEADLARPIGTENPPGLNQLGPSPVLDLSGIAPPVVPEDLTTGCFVVRDEVVGVAECTGRVTHAGLNKDNGLVDPATGSATAPTTPRGMVEENFAKAVAGAIAETRRQWRDLRSGLVARYGEVSAALMVCALTRDDPVAACQDQEALVEQLRGERGAADRYGPVLIGLVAAGVVALLVLFGYLRARRRERS